MKLARRHATQLWLCSGVCFVRRSIANVIAHGVIWASDHKLKWSDLKQGRLYLVAFLLLGSNSRFGWVLQLDGSKKLRIASDLRYWLGAPVMLHCPH